MATPDAVAIIPAYSHIDWRLRAALDAAGVVFYAVHECSDLPLVRSRLLTFALEQTEANTIVLLDSDAAPTPEQLIRLIESPRLDREHAVTGCYQLRNGRLSFLPQDQSITVELRRPGSIELETSGLGFCAIRRESLWAMAQQLPRVDSCGEWWPFCVPFVEGTTYYADDGSLWERARRAGTTLWLDPDLVVDHVVLSPLRPPNAPVTRDGTPSSQSIRTTA